MCHVMYTLLSVCMTGYTVTVTDSCDYTVTVTANSDFNQTVGSGINSRGNSSRGGIRRVIHEHSMQTSSLQDAIRTLEVTRSEQHELQRLADEREDELMQLRLQSQSVTGGQPPGLPNPWGLRMLQEAAQHQPERKSQ
eukprot:6479259-Amphidinium_carterae.2